MSKQTTYGELGVGMVYLNVNDDLCRKRKEGPPEYIARLSGGCLRYGAFPRDEHRATPVDMEEALTWGYDMWKDHGWSETTARAVSDRIKRWFKQEDLMSKQTTYGGLAVGSVFLDPYGEVLYWKRDDRSEYIESGEGKRVDTGYLPPVNGQVTRVNFEEAKQWLKEKATLHGWDPSVAGQAIQRWFGETVYLDEVVTPVAIPRFDQIRAVFLVVQEVLIAAEDPEELTVTLHYLDRTFPVKDLLVGAHVVRVDIDGLSDGCSLVRDQDDLPDPDGLITVTRTKTTVVTERIYP